MKENEESWQNMTKKQIRCFNLLGGETLESFFKIAKLTNIKNVHPNMLEVLPQTLQTYSNLTKILSWKLKDNSNVASLRDLNYDMNKFEKLVKMENSGLLTKNIRDAFNSLRSDLHTMEMLTQLMQESTAKVINSMSEGQIRAFPYVIGYENKNSYIIYNRKKRTLDALLKFAKNEKFKKVTKTHFKIFNNISLMSQSEIIANLGHMSPPYDVLLEIIKLNPNPQASKCILKMELFTSSLNEIKEIIALDKQYSLTDKIIDAFGNLKFDIRKAKNLKQLLQPENAKLINSMTKKQMEMFKQLCYKERNIKNLLAIAQNQNIEHMTDKKTKIKLNTSSSITNRLEYWQLASKFIKNREQIVKILVKIDQQSHKDKLTEEQIFDILIKEIA